jgi:hypothetical protein
MEREEMRKNSLVRYDALEVRLQSADALAERGRLVHAVMSTVGMSCPCEKTTGLQVRLQEMTDLFHVEHRVIHAD